MPPQQDRENVHIGRVAMDIAGPISENGNRWILVVQDYYSKYLQIYPLPRHTAEDVANALVKNFFSRFGVCHRLHSDQGTEFDSQLMHQICKLWGIQKPRTTPFAPWSNGMVERSNRTIKQILYQHCKDMSDWDSWLWSIQMTLNSTRHSSTGMTPFKLFMSRCADPVLPVDVIFGAPRLAGNSHCW